MRDYNEEESREALGGVTSKQLKAHFQGKWFDSWFAANRHVTAK